MARRPRQARSRMLVDAVVEASIQLLERPLAGRSPTVRDIARRAGVGVGSVYDYFDGRDGIFDAVFERVTKENFDSMVAKWESYDALPVEDALIHLLDDTFRLYLARRRVTQVAVQAVMRLGQLRRVVELRDRFARVVAARVVRDVPTAPREEVAHVVLGCVDAIVGVCMSELQRPPDEARTAALRDVMARMIRSEVARLRAWSAPSA